MRGVPALVQALPADRSEVSVIVIWEPVVGSDLRPPARSVAAPLSGSGAQLFWDEELLASQSLLRTAHRHPERVPPDIDLHEGFVVWDVVATWPPGARWDADMPWPDWFGYPVVDAAGELAERLAAPDPAAP